MARTLIVSDRHNSFFSANNIRVGNQIPTEGNYVKGDIIVNIGDNTASEAMWICVESGNPGIWEVVGAGAGGNGGSNFVSINNTVFVNEPVNEVELGLGVAITSKDKLIVHHNSIHLMQNVDYKIEGNKIVKLTEGNWNEDSEEAMFAFELFKNVESVDGNLVELKTKLVCMQNTVTVNGAVNEVKIGIEGFDKDRDTLMVFENETFLTRGLNYEINGNGDGIVPIGDEVWNDVMIDDWSYTFVVFKDVPLVEGENKIGMDLLADDVKKAIQDASNIDLSGYATKEEMNGKVAQGEYNTKIAELEGKVNEAFTSANNGKQLIANAIGEPLSSEDTFSAMSDKINDMKSDLKQVLTDEGVNVTEEDNMASLITKVDIEFNDKNTEMSSLNTTITLLNSQINSLTSELAGKVTPAGTAVAGDVFSGKTFINSTGETITGSMTNQGDKTFTPSASKQTGKAGYYSSVTCNAVSNLTAANIKSGVTVGGVTGTAPIPSGTATAAQVLSGYTFSNGSGVGISGTMANRGGAQTVTPGTSNKTLNAGYYSGNITIAGDADLVAANIVSGKNIFGVAGSATVSSLGGVTPAGTAVAGDVLSGKTFINSTGKTVTGTMANQGAKTFTPSASKQTGAAGYYSSVTCNGDANLVAANIVSGKKIFGVTGTATVSSLGGFNVTFNAGTTVTLYGVQGDTLVKLTTTFTSPSSFKWTAPWTGTYSFTVTGRATNYQAKLYFVKRNASGTEIWRSSEGTNYIQNQAISMNAGESVEAWGRGTDVSYGAYFTSFYVKCTININGTNI